MPRRKHSNAKIPDPGDMSITQPVWQKSSKALHRSAVFDSCQKKGTPFLCQPRGLNESSDVVFLNPKAFIFSDSKIRGRLVKEGSSAPTKLASNDVISASSDGTKSSCVVLVNVHLGLLTRRNFSSQFIWGVMVGGASCCCFLSTRSSRFTVFNLTLATELFK